MHTVCSLLNKIKKQIDFLDRSLAETPLSFSEIRYYSQSYFSVYQPIKFVLNRAQNEMRSIEARKCLKTATISHPTNDVWRSLDICNRVTTNFWFIDFPYFVLFNIHCVMLPLIPNHVKESPFIFMHGKIANAYYWTSTIWSWVRWICRGCVIF